MPCFRDDRPTYTNACRLSKCLGAKLTEVNIKDAVTQHFKDIGHDPEVHDVTYENSQARERTQALMDMANQEGAVLVGTGDLSELALGWATYNGDHMSMYGVNGSVPKTLVRHLVRCYGENCEEAELREVLLDILDTPVSPELLPPKDGEIASEDGGLGRSWSFMTFHLLHAASRLFPEEDLPHCLQNLCRDLRKGSDPQVAEKLYRRFLPSSLNVPAYRTTSGWEAWRFPREVTFGCPATPVRGRGFLSWKTYSKQKKAETVGILRLFQCILNGAHEHDGGVFLVVRVLDILQMLFADLLSNGI